MILIIHLSLLTFLISLSLYESVTVDEAKANLLSGYVITSNGSVDQGVRIGPIDLSQVNMTTLADMGVDTNLVAKLKPYIGLVDQKAVDLLKSNPLILTQPEMDALTEKIKSFAKKIFSKLPPAIQTSPRVVFLKGLEEKNDWVDLLVEVDKTRAELRRLLENPK